MIRNWKITCHLSSPLCGDPPMIDSLLEYELALRLGLKQSKKLTKDITLSEIEQPPIPVAKRTIEGFDIYCASSPILGEVRAEWKENQSGRFDSDLLATMLHPKSRKRIQITGGAYKARFAPLRVRLVDKIIWFVRGAKKEINKLLKNIISLGKNRNSGYGKVHKWEFEETEKDNSIFSDNENGLKILMKKVPIICARNSTGYRKAWGGGVAPYWHPDTFMEVAVPC